MKFVVEKNALIKALSHVQSIVERKNTLPILSNILIEAKENCIILSSTDMDISITEKINHNSIEDGSTTVNASTLYDIVRKLPDNKEIEFIANDGKILSIRSGSSRFSLACLPREDFPIIETEDAGIKLKVDSQTFFKLIEKTKFAISNEETRYFLNGLYFNLRKDEKNNYITIVGTDGHRLSKIDYLYQPESIETIGVIIPKKTINELSKLLSEFTGDINIDLNSNKIIFYINESILISKLIDGNFPDYKRVIPTENKNTLEVKRENLFKAVDRVSTITSDKLPIIKFKLLSNIMNISTSNNENGTATEDVQTIYAGEEIEIGFNSKYVLDMLNNLEDEDIILNFKDNSSPIIATEKSNPDLIYVLMPMRI
mgnify:FL=1